MNQSAINGSAPSHQQQSHHYRQQYSADSSVSQQGQGAPPRASGQEQHPQSLQGTAAYYPERSVHMRPVVIQLGAGAQVQHSYLPPQREFQPVPAQQFPTSYNVYSPQFMAPNTTQYPQPPFYNEGMNPQATAMVQNRMPPPGTVYPVQPTVQPAQPTNFNYAQTGAPGQQVPTHFQMTPAQQQQPPPQPLSAPLPQRKRTILAIVDPESKKTINMEELEEAKNKENEPDRSNKDTQNEDGSAGEQRDGDGRENPASPSLEDKKAVEVRQNFMKQVANKAIETDVKGKAKGEGKVAEAGSAPPEVACGDPTEGNELTVHTRLSSSVPPPERTVTPSAPHIDEHNLHSAIQEKLSMQLQPGLNFHTSHPPPTMTVMSGFLPNSNQPPNGNNLPSIVSASGFQPPFQPILQPQFQPQRQIYAARAPDMAFTGLSSEECNGPDGTDELENGLDTTMSKEDKLRQLEEEFATFMHDSEEKSNIESLVYSSEFFGFMRKVVKELQHVKCPETEAGLIEFGIDLAGMPPSAVVNPSRVTRRFDQGKEGTFVPPWQPGPQPTRIPGGPGMRPNYGGRHTVSDNKARINPKKNPSNRSSMQAIPKVDLLPKKSESAWKSKREEKLADRTADDARYEDIRKELRGLLNKITPSTYEDLSSKFCDYKVHQDPKLLTRIIDLIFDKAVEEPRFCPLYSDLCKKQVDMENLQIAAATTPGDPKKGGSFRLAIIERCQKTFEGEKSSEFTEVEKELEKAEEEKDDAKKTACQERLELLKAKEKRRFLGIILFIAQLYRHDLLIDKIIEWCVVELVKRYGEQNANDEIYIEYAVKMLETVGEIYGRRKPKVPEPATTAESGGADRRKSQAVGRKSQQKGAPTSPAAAASSSAASEQPHDPIEKVLQHLSSIKAKLSNRCRFMIMDLEDMRRNGWQPRREKQGPKTMEEVRNDLEQEAAENQAEREAYERKANASRGEYATRKTSRQNVTGYQGRGSSDNRQQQQNPPLDRRMAAAQASTQATSLNPSAKKEGYTSLRLADTNQKLGKGQPSYFTRKSEHSMGPGTMYSDRAAPSPPAPSMSQAPTPPPAHQTSSPSLMTTVEEGSPAGEKLASDEQRESENRSPSGQSTPPQLGRSDYNSAGGAQVEGN